MPEPRGPIAHPPGLGDISNDGPLPTDRVHVRMKVSGAYPRHRAEHLLRDALADAGVTDPDSITWEWGTVDANGGVVLYMSGAVPYVGPVSTPSTDPQEAP